MKKIIIIQLFVLFCSMAKGQYITPLSLISTSGGIAETTIGGKVHVVEWTIGETIIGEGSTGSLTMTIGEQQHFSNAPNTVAESIFKTVKVYPNPASTFVKIENLPIGNKSISITDITGKIVRRLYSDDGAVMMSTSDLSTGNYLLNIYAESNQHITYKISINKK